MTVLRRGLSVALIASVFTVGSISSWGCSSGTGEPRVANVKPGEMPPDGEWTAEYYDQGIGKIIIIAKGGDVRGKWERPHKEKWAEFTGTIDGNLMKFQWTEYNSGGIGPNTQANGKGYLVYTRPAGDNVDDKLIGEFGRKDDETGDPIEAVKQRNVTPDLDKIGGTGASDSGIGDWDSENHEDGKSEPPTPP